MGLHVKKNGIDNRVGCIPDGYPASKISLRDGRSVEDLSNNEINEYVNLTSYTSDFYEFPYDGYIQIATGESASMSIALKGNTKNNIMYILTSGGDNSSTYVKKGMKVKVNSVTGNASCRYYPIY